MLGFLFVYIRVCWFVYCTLICFHDAIVVRKFICCYCDAILDIVENCCRNVADSSLTDVVMRVQRRQKR